MKIAEANLLLVPGYTNSGPDHWQSRWEAKFPTAKRVQQDDWHKPVVEDWTASVISSIDAIDAPIVVVAHSLGCQTFVQAVTQMDDAQKAKIKGAYLVAPPDVENPKIKPKHLMTFGPYPREIMPFPSIIVASQNDTFCAHDKAQEMATAWGSLFIDAGESGHLNADSGHGPWPEGLLVFAEFMKKL